MNNLIIIHTTDILKRMDNTAAHGTDAIKHRDTSLTHATDAYKKGSPTTVHTTDTLVRKYNGVSHQTDANKLKDPLLMHATDIFKRKAVFLFHTTDANKLKDPLVIHRTDAFLVAPSSLASALGAHSQLGLSTVREFSKNSPLYIDIGGGLFTMVGLPRIATWNTAGRPANPKRGTYGFNTETKRLEVWNGSVWYNVSLTKL